MRNCLTLGRAAEMLVRRSDAEPIEQAEAMHILARSQAEGLVFVGDNVQRRLSYICSCCACCCMQLRALNELGIDNAIKASPLLAEIVRDQCTGCGRCARRCPVQAITLKARGPHDP